MSTSRKWILSIAFALGLTSLAHAQPRTVHYVPSTYQRPTPAAGQNARYTGPAQSSVMQTSYVQTGAAPAGIAPAGPASMSTTGTAVVTPTAGHSGPAHNGCGHGGCGGCSTGGPCPRHHCPPPYRHCMEGPPRLRFRRGCPAPVCPPCDAPSWGYFQTCWNPWPWPANWSHCPVMPPAAVVAPGPIVGASVVLPEGTVPPPVRKGL